MSNTQSHLIVKEEGICIYRAPEKLTCENPCQLPQGICECDDLAIEENEALKQAQSSAILCEDQKWARKYICDHYTYLEKIGSIYPVPGIEFTHEWINPCITEKRCLNADIETCKQTCKKLYIVARLIEHTAEKKMKVMIINDNPELLDLHNQAAELRSLKQSNPLR